MSEILHDHLLQAEVLLTPPSRTRRGKNRLRKQELVIGISKKLHKIIQRKWISVRDIEGFKITGVEITEVITKAITA